VREDRLGNPFLSGNYAPVREEITADDLQVIGKVPAELDGMFVRNGPNPQFPPLKSYHWFEGDGMLHGVRLQGGKASYRNRYVQTDGWKEEHAAGKAIYGSFMDPPDLKRIAAGKSPFKNAANTALVWHNGRLLALWEGGPPHEVKVPGLETVGLFNFQGKLQHPFTAHPKVDPQTGEMLCFGYNPMTAPHVQYTVVDRGGVIVRSTPISIPRPVMMHDFAITARHSIFMDLPETFSMERLTKGQPPLKFEPELGARFGILPRHGKGDEIKWFDATPCFVFHVLNAYDEGDEVVVQACRMKEFPAFLDFQPQQRHPSDANSPAQASSPKLYEWRFNLKTGKVKEGPLDDTDTEFPRVNETLTGRKARYGYCGTGGGDFFDGLIKYDLEKGTNEKHVYGKGRTGGEGVFVPRRDAKTEDDGWLVTYVQDHARGKSEVVLVDARDFTGDPVARILLPARVPYGFHGAWIDLKS
jgi:carotenoid cleavage dioxygenase